jgi:hypothetical protein
MHKIHQTGCRVPATPGNAQEESALKERAIERGGVYGVIGNIII